jgi:hypothetical protein
MPKASSNVRVRGRSGRHLLALSSSQFDLNRHSGVGETGANGSLIVRHALARDMHEQWSRCGICVPPAASIPLGRRIIRPRRPIFPRALGAGLMTRDSFWFALSMVWPFALLLAMLLFAFA